MENLDSYFEKVEEVLKSFPKESQRNYYQNKQSLKIKFEPLTTTHRTGKYVPEENTIIIYHRNSIYHELFHMAFSDKDKVGKKLFQEDLDVYYENGIAHELKCSNQIIIKAKGLTEGFVEYLARKCYATEGHTLEFFFTNLLISIYGEEIINYTLQNDPIGFFESPRFYNILEISEKLDDIVSNEKNMMFIIEYKEIFSQMIYEGTHDEKMKICKILSKTRMNYKKSIIKLFELIILEYEKCKNPQVDKSEFIELLKSFMTESAYRVALAFDDEKCSVKEEISNMIKNFEESKTKKLIDH